MQKYVSTCTCGVNRREMRCLQGIQEISTRGNIPHDKAEMINNEEIETDLLQECQDKSMDELGKVAAIRGICDFGMKVLLHRKNLTSRRSNC